MNIIDNTVSSIERKPEQPIELEKILEDLSKNGRNINSIKLSFENTFKAPYWESVIFFNNSNNSHIFAKGFAQDPRNAVLNAITESNRLW